MSDLEFAKFLKFTYLPEINKLKEEIPHLKGEIKSATRDEDVYLTGMELDIAAHKSLIEELQKRIEELEQPKKSLLDRLLRR